MHSTPRNADASAHPGQPCADELIHALPIGILFTDMADRVRFINRELARLMGCQGEGEDCLGTAVAALLGRLADTEGAACLELSERCSPQAPQSTHLAFQARDGRTLSCSVRLTLDSEGRQLGRIWTFEDVTEADQAQRRLHYLADHDPLTGLFNRRRFQEELERALIAGERSGQRVAFLLFDLDHFKRVNDHQGHLAGDTLLVRMAAVLSGQIRRNEILARLGGDEFAILVPEATDLDVQALADRVVQAVSGLALNVSGRGRRVTCSVGVAFYPDHACTIDTLMQCADAALYQAKNSGRNRSCIWQLPGGQLPGSRTTGKAATCCEVHAGVAPAHGSTRLSYQAA